MPDLFHFTCHHAARRLGPHGVLRLNPQPVLSNARVVWATDLEVADADALGLTSLALRCDRTAHRYRVLEPHRFTAWADWWPRQRFDDIALVSALTHPPVQPAHWWVAQQPVAVERAD